MPAKIKVTREEIIEAGIALVRESSPAALSARAVAKRLNCSTQPIFSNFPSMQALTDAVGLRAYEIYVERTFRDMRAGCYPAYKASGMAYILFAVEEPMLFRMIYMRDRTGDVQNDDTPEAETIVRMIAEKTGLSIENAARLHGDMWIFVHGLASMFVTGFHTFDEEAVSEQLTRVYFSLLAHYQDEGSDPDDRDRDQVIDKTV